MRTIDACRRALKPLGAWPKPTAPLRCLAGLLLLSALLGGCGSPTRFCPISHRLGDYSCRVCDSDGTRTLVEHFNADSNDLTLSIHESGRVTWIQHPRTSVSAWHDRVQDNTIVFNRSDPSRLIANGRDVSIVPVK